MRFSRFLPVVAVAALALAGCSDPDSGSTDGDTDTSQSGAASSGFDFSQIQTVPDIAAMVPEEVRERNVLRNGASVDYAPAEFWSSDGKTTKGYDVDINNAIAKVMGLDEGTTSHAEFPTIIPALGTKYDLGISSFTITPDRLDQANMISYVEVGSAYAVKEGNPKHFNPDDPCGTTIGVQNGTFQFDYIRQISQECVEDGNPEIKIMPHDLQTDIATKVIGGLYDAMFGDSTVIGYDVTKSHGQLEQVGATFESSPQGIAIAKSDEQLTAATQAAVQYLMDEGYLAQIMAQYGSENAALSKAQINPKGK